MALRLLSKTETKDVEVGGTKFVVRKLPHGLSAALLRKHTSRGRVDEAAFDREVWTRILVGWTGLRDAAGREIAFSTDEVEWPDPLTEEKRKEPLAYVVAMSLPVDVAAVLMNTARSAEAVVEEALGNSDPSSSSGR